jgi:hypothetical protein
VKISSASRLSEVRVPVPGKLRHHRMHAARVIADDAADRSTIVRHRIGSEGKPMRRRVSAQIVEHDAAPRGAEPFLQIDRDKVVEVFRHIQHDRDVAALARETCAAAARKDGRTVPVRDQNCLCDVFDLAPITAPIGTSR